MMRLEGLSRKWGDFELRDISLSLAPGEYCAVVGPIGSGKTLLLQTIAGLHPPHTGRVWLADRDVSVLPPEQRQVGYVPQRASVFPHMPVRDNIAYGLRYHGLRGNEAQQRVEEAIELLGLGDIAHRRHPSLLSGGEAQKVALARALAIRPRVLLLDEPLGSLDYNSRQEVSSALSEINEKLRVPVIHVTHDYTEAASLAHTVAVVRNGALMQVGPVEEVFWRPNSYFVAQFLGVENVLPAKPTGNGQVVVGNMRWRTASSAIGGEYYAAVRPQDIVVGEAARNLPNQLTASVTSVSDEGFSLRVTLATGGVELVAFLPRRAYSASPLTVGEEVTVGFDATAVHLFADEEE